MSRRAKAAEQSYLSLYKRLADAPDPVAALEQTVQLQRRLASLQVSRGFLSLSSGVTHDIGFHTWIYNFTRKHSEDKCSAEEELFLNFMCFDHLRCCLYNYIVLFFPSPGYMHCICPLGEIFLCNTLHNVSIFHRHRFLFFVVPTIEHLAC